MHPACGDHVHRDHAASARPSVRALDREHHARSVHDLGTVPCTIGEPRWAVWW